MSDIPIKYGKFKDTDGVVKKAYFVNTEKAIYDNDNQPLDQKLIGMKNTINSLQETIVGLQNSIAKLNSDLNNNWTNLTLEPGVEDSASGYGGRKKLSYRKIGNQVYISGGVAITNYTGSTHVATLPVGYRPESSHYYFVTMAGFRIARCYITASGRIVVEWAKNIADGSDITSILWSDISCNFPVS